MPNPYASTGSVATVTAAVAGNNKLDQANNDAPSNNNQDAHFTTKDILARLFAYVRSHAVLLVCSFIAAAISIVLQLYIPILMGRGIDLLLGAGHVDFAALAPLLAQLAGTVVIAALLQWLQGYGISRLAYNTARDLRVDAHSKLTRVPIAYIDGHAHGDIMSRVTNDVDQVCDGLLQGTNQLFSGIITIAATLAFMLTASLPMALVVMLVTPLSMLAATLIAKASSKSFTEQMRLQGALAAYAEEYIGAQKLVQAFAYEERSCKGFADINRKLYVAGEHAQFMSSLSNPGTRFVNNLIYALVAVVGCVGVLTGIPAALTVGQVQIFLSYANQYTKPFNEISGVITQIQSAFASARRVFALMDAPEEELDVSEDAVWAPADDTHASKGATCLLAAGAHERGMESHALKTDMCALDASATLRGKVEFDHVDFSYVPTRKLLQDICIKAELGMRMALVGPTGCGKTTLINLLLRFYDVDAGEIRIDGRPLSSYVRSSLRKNFGMVLQESWLFEGTVHENIAYGCPDATREQVVKAAQKARAHKFICTLSQGYDTVLSEDGGSLSQGQRQLLCIARVMLANPSILLLDEATSSIDTRTELQVQAAFDELMRGRTSFVVAHRLSTIRNADCILVMRNGRIVERGTHDELLAANGFYAELYNSQFAPSA